MAVLTGGRGEIIQITVPSNEEMRPRGSFWAPSTHLVGLVLEDIKPGRTGAVLLRGVIEDIPKINETINIRGGDTLCTGDRETAVANTHVSVYSIRSGQRNFRLLYGRTASESRATQVRLRDGDYTPTELAAEMRNRIRNLNISGFNFNTFQVTYDATERKYTWSVGPAGTNVVRRIGFDWTSTGRDAANALLAPILGFTAGTNVAIGAIGASVESPNPISSPTIEFSSFVGYATERSRSNDDGVNIFLTPGIG